MLKRPIVIKLMCVALVVAIVFPLGNAVYPFVSPELTGGGFEALEAVVSATLGFGIYALLFG